MMSNKKLLTPRCSLLFSFNCLQSELTNFLHVLWDQVKDGTDFIQTLVTLQDQVEVQIYF